MLSIIFSVPFLCRTSFITFALLLFLILSSMFSIFTPKKAPAEVALELEILKEQNRAKELDIDMMEISAVKAHGDNLGAHGDNLTAFRKQRSVKKLTYKTDPNELVDSSVKKVLLPDDTDDLTNAVDIFADYRTMAPESLRMVPAEEIKELLDEPVHSSNPNLLEFLGICQAAGALVLDRKKGLTQEQFTVLSSCIESRKLTRVTKTAALDRINKFMNA